MLPELTPDVVLIAAPCLVLWLVIAHHRASLLAAHPGEPGGGR